MITNSSDEDTETEGDLIDEEVEIENGRIENAENNKS